jgi:hypothetical protein
MQRVWLYLIQDLVARKFIDLPPNRALKAYTAELIEEVKKIVLGPKTWSRPSRARPVVSREHRIPASSDSPFQILRLIPGGRYLTVQIPGRIDLWDVAACALVWSFEHDHSLWPRHVELVDDECSAICLGFDTPRVLSVIRIDLNTGCSTELCRVDAPPDTEFSGGLEASDEFFICPLILSVWPTKRYFMLGSWRTETIVTVFLRVTYEPGSSVSSQCPDIFLSLIY